MTEAEMAAFYQSEVERLGLAVPKQQEQTQQEEDQPSDKDKSQDDDGSNVSWGGHRAGVKVLDLPPPRAGIKLLDLPPPRARGDEREKSPPLGDQDMQRDGKYKFSGRETEKSADDGSQSNGAQSTNNEAPFRGISEDDDNNASLVSDLSDCIYSLAGDSVINNSQEPDLLARIIELEARLKEQERVTEAQGRRLAVLEGGLLQNEDQKALKAIEFVIWYRRQRRLARGGP